MLDFPVRSYRDMLHKNKAFCSLVNTSELASLLDLDKRKLLLTARKPKYQVYKIPKRSGGQREIENPDKHLKNIQNRLNQYLQSVYFFEKSPAAYGFVMNEKGATSDRRDVLWNARKHLAKDYLLNVDLKDFFHYITQTDVRRIFLSKPFRFNPKLCTTIGQLTTYKGRLPMGTPTSPVLSNFACLDLDNELLKLARYYNWVFTRYADDMTFSSRFPIDKLHIEAITKAIESAGFEVNPKKVKKLWQTG